MTLEINEEMKQTLRDFRAKYGDEAAREALRFYLTGLSHAMVLCTTFATEAANELGLVLDEARQKQSVSDRYD